MANAASEWGQPLELSRYVEFHQLTRLRHIGTNRALAEVGIIFRWRTLRLRSDLQDTCCGYRSVERMIETADTLYGLAWFNEKEPAELLRRRDTIF